MVKGRKSCSIPRKYKWLKPESLLFSYGTAVYKKPSNAQRLWIPEIVNGLQERQDKAVM